MFERRRKNIFPKGTGVCEEKVKEKEKVMKKMGEEAAFGPTAIEEMDKD